MAWFTTKRSSSSGRPARAATSSPERAVRCLGLGRRAHDHAAPRVSARRGSEGLGGRPARVRGACAAVPAPRARDPVLHRQQLGPRPQSACRACSTPSRVSPRHRTQDLVVVVHEERVAGRAGGLAGRRQRAARAPHSAGGSAAELRSSHGPGLRRSLPPPDAGSGRSSPASQTWNSSPATAAPNRKPCAIEPRRWRPHQALAVDALRRRLEPSPRAPWRSPRRPRSPPRGAVDVTNSTESSFRASSGARQAGQRHGRCRNRRGRAARRSRAAPAARVHPRRRRGGTSARSSWSRLDRPRSG